MKSEYKVGDVITLKTYEELIKCKDQKYAANGFFIKEDGLFIHENMYRFLGKEYKIKKIDHEFFILEITSTFDWWWSENCVKKVKQLEFEF